MRVDFTVANRVWKSRFPLELDSLRLDFPPENKTKNHSNAETQNRITATQKSQQRSWENTTARRNREQRKNPEIASQQCKKKSWFLGLDFCSDWDCNLGLGFWEMDLDEEGRRDLDEMDFWGLGRREEDGEQDLKWRKNGRRWWTGPEMEKKERRKKIHKYRVS